MIKFGGGEDGQSVQRAKYIISAVAGNNGSNGSNTITLNGAELIPIDWGGRLVSNPSVSVNELGKQLLKAALEGDVDQIKALLTKGAPFTADWLGTSPLHLAAQNNHLEITEILLRAGISKDARTKVDRTPLHMAAYEGHLQIVDALIKNGADINCKDLLRMTPLHWAAQNGHLEVAAHLLRNGAAIDEVNKFNLTPLQIANQIGRSDLENLLTGSIADTAVATQNLVLQLASDDVTETHVQELTDEMEVENNEDSCSVFQSFTVDPSVLQEFEHSTEYMDETSQNEVTNDEYEEETDQERIEKENEQLVQHVTVDPSTFTSASLKLLEEHGITMLHNDDTSILNRVIENGHSVVLTDIGKEVLNSFKQSEQRQQQVPVLPINKKVVTITPEQFLAMTNKTAVKKLKVVPSRSPFKRVVMKKNRVTPISNFIPVSTYSPVSTITSIAQEHLQIDQPENVSQNERELANQLVDARNTIEEYKMKLKSKQGVENQLVEARNAIEQYKIQLRKKQQEGECIKCKSNDPHS